jgi:hypothetical protein
MLKNLSVKKRLGLLSVIFIVGMCLLFFLGILGMNLLSAMRAYVGAAGIWSGGQKDSFYYLNKYMTPLQKGVFFFLHFPLKKIDWDYHPFN